VRGGRLFVVLGPRARWRTGNPFTAELLRRQIPDIGQRQAFVCGPPPLQSAAEAGLRKAGVPTDRIMSERFGW
jgi:ferredoxin-NADP reductase